jgi:hypothetical protein
MAMTEHEALIRDLGRALLHGWNCRAPTREGEECRELLQHAAEWLERQRRKLFMPFTIINGGKQ